MTDKTFDSDSDQARGRASHGARSREVGAVTPPPGKVEPSTVAGGSDPENEKARLRGPRRPDSESHRSKEDGTQVDELMRQPPGPLKRKALSGHERDPKGQRRAIEQTLKPSPTRPTRLEPVYEPNRSEIKADLAKRGLIGDEHELGPQYSPTSSDKHSGGASLRWEDRLAIVTREDLEEARIRKAVEAAVAAGYRLPTTREDHVRAILIAASLARYLAGRGRDTRGALRLYVQRKRELESFDLIDALVRAALEWLQWNQLSPKEQRRQKRAAIQEAHKREPSASNRELGRRYGVDHKTVGEWLKD
jgi:hypothetical protein